MPFLEPDAGNDPGLRAPSGVAPPNPTVPAVDDAIAATFRQENPLTNVFRTATRETFPVEAGHNPLDVIKATKYEANWLDNFMHSGSEAETRAIMRRIDSEEEDRKTIEAAGSVGVIAGIAAGTIDPTIALPAGVLVKSVKGGYSVMKSARVVALAGAAQSSAQEGTLQAAQETRTWEESTANIATATILSGILGAGAAGLLTKVERAALENALGADRAFIDAHVEGTPITVDPKIKAEVDRLATEAMTDNPNMTPAQIQDKTREILEKVQAKFPEEPAVAASTGLPEAVGAAATDTRALERVPALGKTVGDAVDKLRAAEIPFLSRAAAAIFDLPERFNPMARLLGAESPTGRRAAVDLAETPLRFEQNLEGIPTTAGPALDRVARLVINQSRVAVADEFDRLFAEYRFRRPDTSFPRARAQFEQFMGRGEGFMSPSEFKAEVARAASQGDKHEIPQVAQAAAFIRARVFEPWKQRAIKAGLFPEDMGVTGAESYFQRIYNKKLIAARRPDFVDRVTNWLRQDQQTKADAKQRLEFSGAQLKSWQSQINKLEARLQRLDVRGRDLMGRLDERASEVSRMEQRGNVLEERAALIAEDISEVEDFIRAMREEVQDPGLRERLNILEQEAAEAKKADRTMTEAQLREVEKEELSGILSGTTRMAAEMVTGKRNVPKVPSFLTYIVTNGGLKDPGGDVRSVVGGASARPGLINQQKGRALDELGRKLQEEFPGQFPQRDVPGGGAPSDAEILEWISDAARGRQPGWWIDELPGNDKQLLEAGQAAVALDEVLTRAGVEVKNVSDVAKILRDGKSAGGVTLADLEKIAADLEAAGESIPAGARRQFAESELGAARQEFADLRAIMGRAREASEAKANRLKVAEGRGAEAGMSERFNRGRLGILEDRLSQADLKRELVQEALVIANRQHEEVRAKIEAELGAWDGKSAQEAKAAIKAREKYIKERGGREEGASRLAMADDAVDRVLKRILNSDRDQSDLELRARAEEITNRILGSPDGRLPYDIHEGGPEIGWRAAGEPPRGPLARRDFAIPDDMIRDYLEDDAEQVVAMHLRTIVPDVLLTEKFGDVKMTEVFRKVDEEYNALAREASSEKERTRIEKERQRVTGDLAAIRDRVRSVYGWSTDPIMQNAARIAGAVKNYNVLTSMGMATISSLPDMAGAVFRHGLGTVFRDAWQPFFGHLTGQSDAWKAAKEQYRAMGIATEIALATRHHSLDDINDVYRPQSRTERTLQAGTDAFMVANMLAPWTDWGKVTASIVSGNEIIRASKAVSEGKATKKQIAALAESNIDAATATRIWEQFQTGGEVRDGVHLPNTKDWTDPSARLAFEGAVAREADIAVVTPGQEKALWLSQPVIGTLGQFKTFMGSATERILIANLQRRDANTLQGLVFSLGLGMLSYKINSLAGGQPTSDRPQDWVKEGFARTGMAGWFEEGNAMMAKGTRGTLDVYRLIGADKPLSRYVSRSGIDAFLGPTVGKVNNVLKVAGAGATGEWTGGDTRALRQLFAMQNLVWFRGALNQVERASNDAFGVENLPQQ